MRTRLKPDARKGLIEEGALEAALEIGFAEFTRTDVAAKADVSEGLVTHYFGNMDALRRRVMEHAVERGILPLVAIGLTAGHPVALGAPVSLKSKALSSLL